MQAYKLWIEDKNYDFWEEQKSLNALLSLYGVKIIINAHWYCNIYARNIIFFFVKTIYIMNKQGNGSSLKNLVSQNK